MIMISPHLSIAVNKWEMISIVKTVGHKYQCDLLIKGFKERTQRDYYIWRKEKGKIIKSFEESSNYSRMIVRINAKVLNEKENNELISTCKLLEKQLAKINDKPDSRLNTPQSTWKLYLASLQVGDKKTANKCLTGVAKQKWGNVLSRLNLSQMRKLSNSINEFKISSLNSDNFAEAVVTKHDGHAGFVYFSKYRNEWKINEM